MKFTLPLLAALATICAATPTKAPLPGYGKSPEELALMTLEARHSSCCHFKAGESDCMCQCGSSIYPCSSGSSCGKKCGDHPDIEW
ncbi:hypothetical protein LX36DRAFT_661035 [Colletotrichum falcatum]|nr:hypothetical protein LX36DRAFT_661035 [Colletotrichum falcatum]